MIVYVDVLLAVNFAVNFLLLRITALFCRKQPSSARLCAGAAVGALGALIIFLPPMGIIVQTVYRVGLTMMMCSAVFCPCKASGYIKSAVYLMLCSMALCGALLLWQITVRPVGFAMSGGAVYFDIGALALLLCCAAGYAAACVIARVTQNEQSRGFCTVTVLNNGVSAAFTALIDTGSSLSEPFSGLPVIVCEQKALGRTLPEGISRFIEGGSPPEGIRLIPYKTLGGDGILPAFLPQRAVLQRESGKACAVRCYIAATDIPFGGDYSAVCNPAAFLYETKSGGSLYENSNKA